MTRTVRPSGAIKNREKIRLAVMLGLLVVVVFIVVQGLSFLGGGGGGNREISDPDATAALPDFDRGPLRGAGPEEESLDAAGAHVLGLLGDGGPLADAGHRGYAWPDAAAVAADPEAHRGEYAKAIGRIVSVRERTIGDRTALESRIRDGAAATWRVVSRESPGEPGDVVKVAGVIVGVDAQDAPVLVAIHAWPSVPREHIERIDFAWARLASDATTEESLDLRTRPVFLALAWARTRGPDGFAGDVADGVVEVEPIPTGTEFREAWRSGSLRGNVYRVEGRVDAVVADHDLPENAAGLESVYRVELRYDRGGRVQWLAALLAPRGALPERLGPGDRVVAEGLYLKMWSTDDPRGRLVQVPLLVSPRVRLADAEEER